MNISPNTVKTFLRLIMLKMSVTTRSGVIGKLISGAHFGDE
jgi:DNA-binding CsgD family transcriptional regulator